MMVGGQLVAVVVAVRVIRRVHDSHAKSAPTKWIASYECLA